MRLYLLILGILGVWRVTHLLGVEDGPWDLMTRIRRLSGDGFWGRLFECFYCLSLWVAAPFAWVLGQSAGERWLLWPALSGAAILIERLTAERTPATPPYWKEEDLDAVLRKDEGGA